MVGLNFLQKKYFGSIWALLLLFIDIIDDTLLSHLTLYSPVPQPQAVHLTLPFLANSAGCGRPGQGE
jgi:hypothetical protein